MGEKVRCISSKSHDDRLVLQEPCVEVAVPVMRCSPWVARRRGMRASVQHARSIEVYGCESLDCMCTVRNRRRTRMEST